MAADRARVLAAGSADPLLAGEAARNLAVLARKAGWHEQALSIAPEAAGDPQLKGNDPRLTAERGLLIQSAAYIVARSGDRDGMRELTAEAAATRLPSARLPTTERRARYRTDTARAYAAAGRRDDSIQALLAAEREASEETHARPAIRDLISGLLITGRTGPELRGLAERCGIT